MQTKYKKKKGRLLILLIMLLSCGQTAWADEIKLRTSIGIGGKYQYNREIPVTVTLNNEGEDFAGKLQILIKGSRRAYDQNINIAGGSTQTVILPVNNEQDNYQKAVVRVLDEKEHIAASKDIVFNGASWSEGDLVIGVLSDDADSLSYMADIQVNLKQNYETQLAELHGENIDEKAESLDLVDLLLINDFNTSSLLPEQLSAIKSWVRRGGTLIIGTGVNSNKVLSGLTDEGFLPVRPLSCSRQQTKIQEKMVTLEMTSLQYDHELAEQKGIQIKEKPLYDVFSAGAGQILVMKYDMGLLPMGNFEGNKELWKQILKNELTVDKNQDNDTYYIQDQLARVSNTRLPSAGKLTFLITVYIVTLGVGSYLLLKRKNKKEYIWWVAPGLALAATGILYGMSLRSRLTPFVLNNLDVICEDPKGSVRETSYRAVINTKGKDFKIEQPEDVNFQYITDLPRYDADEDEYTAVSERIHYEGSRRSYEMKDCKVYDSMLIKSTSRVTDAPDYHGTWTRDGNDYTFQFINKTTQPLQALFIIQGERGWAMGEVAPGEEIEKKLSVSDSRPLYELTGSRKDKESVTQRETETVMEIVRDVWLYDYQSIPYCIAITRKGDEVAKMSGQKIQTEFNYQAVIKRLDSRVSSDGRADYPYGFYPATVLSQKGSGAVDSVGDHQMITGNTEAVFEYELEDDVQPEELTLGNDMEMVNYYGGCALKGEAFIYNYQTQQFEKIDLSKGKEYTLSRKMLSQYVKDHKVRVKIIGQDEEGSLAPDIKVRGVRHVTD